MLVGLGEMAGLATAVSWAISCQIHTMIGRRVGAASVTVIRVPLFVAAVALVAFAFGADTATPAGAAFFLSCSALAGIAIADPVFYVACVAIGPRLTLLIQASFTSCLTALLGYIFLGENIGLTGIAGILITTAGVAFVLLEGGTPAATSGVGNLTREQLWRGSVLAFIAALALAVSYLCMKQGLREGIDPLWGAVVRVASGGAFLWAGVALRGRLFAVLRRGWSSRGIPLMLVYGCAVSTVGNCLAVVAMHHVESGVVATLVGLQPIAIIPVIAVVERKYPTARALVGTFIAFAGMALLFLR